MPVGRTIERPGADVGSIVVAAPVRSLSAVDMARLSNWALGYGAQLIPAHAPMVPMTASSEHIFRYRVRPRYQALERRWAIRIRRTSGVGTAVVKVPSGASGVTVSVVDSPEDTVTHEFTETLTSQSATEGDLTLAITPSATNMILETVACWEIPRASLALAAAGSELGTDPGLLSTEAPIRRDTIEGVFQGCYDPTLIGRRVSCFQWGAPYSVGGSTSTSLVIAVTSTSYVNVFGASGLPVLLRKDTRGALTGTLRGRVYAWVTGGNADVRLNSSVNGASTAVLVSSTTPAWSGAMDLTADCEDLASTDGRQTAATPVTDFVHVEARKNTSGTLYIATVSGWEN